MISIYLLCKILHLLFYICLSVVSGTGGKRWSGNKEATNQFKTQASNASSGSFDDFTTSYPPQPGAQQIGQGTDHQIFTPNTTNSSPRDTHPQAKIHSNNLSMTAIHDLSTSTSSYKNVPGLTGTANTGISTGGASNLATGRSDLPPVDMTNRGSYTQVQPYQPYHNAVCKIIQLHITCHAVKRSSNIDTNP